MCAGHVSAGATHHNLTALAGYLPCRWGDGGGVARRANLVSAALAAAGIALFFAALRGLMPLLPAVFGTLFTALSHSLWWHATVAEAYAANVLACGAVLHALVRHDRTRDERWLWWAGVAAGLGAFNHLQMGMWMPALVVAAASRPQDPLGVRAARALRAGAAILVGLVPLLLAFLTDLRSGSSAGRAAGELAGGEFTRAFFTYTAAELARTGRLFLLQWGWPSLVLAYAAWGAVRLARAPGLRTTGIAAAVAFAVNTTFFAGYPTWDKYAFLMSSFLLVSFVGAVGIQAAFERYGQGRRGRLALVAAHALMVAYVPLFFRSLPRLARTSALWAEYRPAEAARLTMFDGVYRANPDKHGYDDVERYASGLGAALPQGATLVDHVAGTFFQLRHAQHYRRWRPDVELRAFVPSGLDPSRWPSALPAAGADEALTAARERRPVFVTSIHLAGFVDVLGALLDRDYTLVERPVAPGLTVQELVPGREVAGPGVLARLEPTSGGVIAHFPRRNPPLRLGVAWRAAGEVPPRRAYRIAFDSPPVRFDAPPAATGVDVDAFGVALGSLNWAGAPP
jgi:hypothetical protein